MAKLMSVSASHYYWFENETDSRCPKPLGVAIAARILSTDLCQWLTLLGHSTDPETIERLEEEAKKLVVFSLLAKEELELSESDLVMLLGACRAVKRPLSVSVIKALIENSKR